MRTLLKRFCPNFDDLPQRLAYKMACYLNTGLGQGGITYISAGETKTGGPFCVLHAWEDTLITAITFAPGSANGTCVGRVLLAGDREYFICTSITIGSGFATLSHSSQPFSA